MRFFGFVAVFWTIVAAFADPLTLRWHSLALAAIFALLGIGDEVRELRRAVERKAPNLSNKEK